MRTIKDYQELVSHLYYNKKTGVFTWNKDLSTQRRKGALATGNKSQKFEFIRHKNVLYSSRKVAWFILYNEIVQNVWFKTESKKITPDNLTENINERFRKIKNNYKKSLPVKYPSLQDEVKNPDSRLLAKNCFVPLEQVALWAMV